MKPARTRAVFVTPSGASIKLRRLSRRDLPQLLIFANALVSEKKVNPDLGIVSLDRKVSHADERRYLNRVLEGIRKQEFVSVAASDGDKLVGNCDIVRRTPYDVRHTGVLGIVLLDGYRGMGLGEAMMRNALEQALSLGVWLVELEVFANNRTAWHLYKKLGFREVGMVPQKIQRGGRGIDEIQMYIDLRISDKSTTQARTPG
ncbi:MAG: GNAT family N-acetyltransferase [Thaumarchaeota archaeon]|nr:GNAT family N-acetyltransferase [Nitrososphaerota archaeon]